MSIGFKGEVMNKDNALKNKILDRLYETSSICSICGEAKCMHGGNRRLTPMLDTDDVLKAINLNEYFYSEN